MISGSLVHPLRLAILVVGLVLSALTLSAAPARADLRVCNQSANPVSIALGYRADKGWPRVICGADSLSAGRAGVSTGNARIWRNRGFEGSE
jgi:hypothetical protein